MEFVPYTDLDTLLRKADYKMTIPSGPLPTARDGT